MTQTPTEDNKQPFTAVLTHWFGPEEDAIDLSLWFSGTEAIDADLAERFGALHDAACRGALDGWAETPRGAVALVVLLDQLSRNLHRGTPKMFANDHRAAAIAERLLDDAELSLPPAQRAALALCLSHVEDTAKMARAIQALQALKVDPATRGSRKPFKRILMSARKRYRVLARFGRFPHRNALLGRQTTADEADHLAQEQSRSARSVQPHRRRADRLKVLVLHSFRQSGARLASRTKKLQAALEDIAELIFIDAPHPYQPDASERAMLEADFETMPDFSAQRCWWNSDDSHTAYTGWEDAIRAIEAHLPVDGVLGFSQGAAMTGLLAALKPSQVRFVLCASGFPSRAAAHDMLMRPGSIDVPSLHIYGERDVLVDNSRTLALAECFIDAEVCSHPAGHFAPDEWPMARLREFLLRFTTAPPPPRRQLTAPEWATVLSRDAPPADMIRPLLPRDRGSLVALLLEAEGLRKRVLYNRGLPIEAPHPGDVAHHIWLAAWQQSPEAVIEAISASSDWAGLARLSVVAADHPALVGHIADRFTAQLQADSASPRPSRAAEAAPRRGSAVERVGGLGHQIATRLRPASAAPGVYIAYRRQIVALSRRAKALRRPRRRPRHFETPASAPLSPEILRPRPVPVVPCPLPELTPLLRHLSAKDTIQAPAAFPRGTVMPDGRLDLCKQVVGPAGITPLLSALEAHPQVERLLLGNNVIGSAGARAVAEFIRSGRSRLKVWYIAGNEIHAEDLLPIAEALAGAPAVEGLWLKRNPLGPDAGPILARLLRSHPRLDTLDLVNTGLLDAGAAPLLDAAAESPALRHLYLGTNGLSTRSAAAIGRLLSDSDQLDSLYVSCNRLGDDGVRLIAAGLRHNRGLKRLGLASNRIGPEGARTLADALKGHPSLQFLDLGWTRATSAVGEAGNRLLDRGAEHIAALLRGNPTLRGLDVSHNRISQVGLNHISDALAENTALTWLRCPQFGKASNPDAMAVLRGRLARNRAQAGIDEATAEEVRAPRSARDILSVYRTQPVA